MNEGSVRLTWEFAGGAPGARTQNPRIKRAGVYSPGKSVTWGAYPPGIARTVVNCNQNCNHRPGAGVVRQVEARSGLDAGPGASAGRGPRDAADFACGWRWPWMVRCRCAVHAGGRVPHTRRTARAVPSGGVGALAVGVIALPSGAAACPVSPAAAVLGADSRPGEPAGARGWAGVRPGLRCQESRPAPGRGRASGYARMRRDRPAVRGYRDSIRPTPHSLPPRPAMRAQR